MFLQDLRLVVSETIGFSGPTGSEVEFRTRLGAVDLGSRVDQNVLNIPLASQKPVFLLQDPKGSLRQGVA